MKKFGLRDYKRQAVTFVAAVMLLLLYCVIFSFSDQDAEQSGNVSYMISEKCVEVINIVSGREWTAAFRRELALYLEHPIRKLAHFSEYAFMGILVYAMWRPWISQGRKLYALILLWVFLSAAGDEFHQLYVSGRNGSFQDVLLDTGGGAFGVLLCVSAEKLLVCKLKKKRSKS